MIESHRKRSANESEITEPHSLRSSGHFDYKTDCIFCGCSDPYDGRKSEFRLIPARTSELRETILQACEKYSNELVDTVKPCVLFAPDSHAVDVVYHQKCSVNFRTGKQIPQIFSSRQFDAPSVAKCPKLIGRPKDEVRNEAFLQVVRYLEENYDEQITINDLIDHMRLVIAYENCEPYSFKYMKDQLRKYFGDRITITEINGKPNWSHSTALLPGFSMNFTVKDRKILNKKKHKSLRLLHSLLRVILKLSRSRERRIHSVLKWRQMKQHLNTFLT